MTVTVEKLRQAIDQRGLVFEPLDVPGLAAQRNVHVVTTGPGHIRGNHFHIQGTEVTAVMGPARVRYREDGVMRDVEVPRDETWRFTFPPRVAHAFQNTGTGPMIIVSFNTMPHDPAAPDTTRDVIL
ncbi:MAG TPA: hypothetical protein VIT67_13780 [Povalibacter sp.]